MKYSNCKMNLPVTLIGQHILNNPSKAGRIFVVSPSFLQSLYMRAEDLTKQKSSLYWKQTSLSDCHTRKMTELVEFVYDKEASAYERT
ncbi:hypothetical protein ABE59_11435 [Bacillus safensis]|nr:hypothetical protein [Bacillus safensis]